MKNGSPKTDSTALPITQLRLALELEIPSDVRYIEGIVQLITRQCEVLAYHPRHCSLNVPVAVTEALSNAILRGNDEDPGKMVRVRAEVDCTRLIVDVVDEGSGFDLAKCLIDPTSPENLAREDGRGLFLMARLMDRIERVGNRRNIVRLTLHRHE